MRLKAIILLVFYFGLATLALAQKNGTSKGHKTSRMSTSKAKILCPIFNADAYPYQGLGFKLGDPFAITYKFYFNKYFSLVADVGKASSGLYSRYYHDRFNDYIISDTLTEGANFQYLANKIKSDWIGELKVLYAFDAKRISKGLQIYAGLGLQGKSTKLQYTYLYNNTNGYYAGQFDRRRITLGQTTILGIEYSYFNLPVSAFLEMELFTDIMRDPGWQRFQGGVGLRYVF
jgi:hypothetical protein